MIQRSTTRPVPGQQIPSRDFTAQHQRVRIISALAEEASQKGYRAVTIADIVKRAAVARNTFYENFSSKEDCFLAAQQQAISTALERVVGAAGEIDDWPLRVEAGLGAFLRYVSEESPLVRTCMLESFSAGPDSFQHHEESLQVFVSLFKLGRDVSPIGAALPETFEEALIGGVFWIVYQRLVNGEAKALEDLLPEIVEFVLTPYLGTAAARQLASNEGEELGVNDD